MTVPPLLLIAEGRRARPRKAPLVRPKEVSLHKDVARLLRAHCRAEWIWFHCPNGEVRDARTAAKLKAMGVRAGIPDLALVPPFGPTHWLELKRPGEELSDAQEAFRMWATRHGVPMAVCSDMGQVLTAFAAWGCLNDGAAALVGVAR